MDTENPHRGPLLLISCQKNHTVPDVATRANYKRYGVSTAVTDLKQVADFVLGWLTRRGISTTRPFESRHR